MKVFRFLGALFLLLVLYLLFFPVPIEPAAWSPSPAPAMEGDYAVNEKLKDIEQLFSGFCPQCEDVAIDSRGRIYGSASDGRILRFAGAEALPEVLANTGGRPLGLDFDRSGNLIVADAVKGLLSIDPAGDVRLLVAEHGGRPFLFTDDVEVGPDGRYYFSDASWRFPIKDYKLDILEHRPNGRLLVYDPLSGQTDLLCDSLYFANGVAVSADTSFVLVNETNTYSVRRYWLSGPRAGTSEMFIENLPSFPDGISRGSDGIFWLALVSPRNALVDQLMDKPFWRKVLARLPAFLQPAPQPYGFVLGLDSNGKVIYNLQDPAGGFSQITSVQEYQGQLYLGSLTETAIGRVAK